MASDLLQYKHLLLMLTWGEIKARYKQSILGFLWAIFMPVVIVAAGLLVRKAFAVIAAKPLELSGLVSVSVKALPWAFFVGSIRFATHSLTNNVNLVTKIYFPREVLPFSSVLAHLFDFGIASVALVALLATFHTEISIHLLWLPLLLGLLILLTAGLALFLSCANLFFRDVKYIVEVLLSFSILFTPVFYEASLLGNWATLLLLNPVASILEGINDVVVLHKPPEPFWLIYAASWAIIGPLIAAKIFDKAEAAFAENV